MAQTREQVEAAAAGSSTEERRRSPRYVCEGFVEALAFHPETLVRGEICNIGQTGCFVKTRARLKLERATRVELRFAVDGSRYRMDAVVTEVRGTGGMGLQFVPGDTKAEGSLTALLERLSAAKARKQ